jgi:hypothetical protein
MSKTIEQQLRRQKLIWYPFNSIQRKIKIDVDTLSGKEANEIQIKQSCVMHITRITYQIVFPNKLGKDAILQR